MPWLLLFFAGLLEVCWAIGLKYSDGFRRPGATLFTAVTLVASMLLLARAARVLPIGTAYGVWVGVGAFGAAVLGMILFDEPVTAPRVGFLVMLLVAIVGLKLTS